MPALFDYTNVYDTAIKQLRLRGFQVWVDEEAKVFCAERHGSDLVAESPVGLLGLACILDAVHPTEFAAYWWRDENAAGEYERLPRQPTPYVSVVRER